MAKITYGMLFTYLEQLGFKDTSPNNFERVFEHLENGMLFAFSMVDDASVDREARGADIMSVEVRLQHEGLITGSLADATLRLSEL